MRAAALLVLFTLAGLGVAQSAEAGMGDPDVAALQVALRSNGFHTGTIDGMLGPQTASAVSAYQASAGLPPTGRAGVDTVSALGGPRRALSRARGLARGSALTTGATGWDVAALQFALAWHGFPSGEFNGVFGARLERSVKRFQRWAGLDVDGVAGAATKKALRRKPPVSRLPLTVPVSAPLADGFGPRDARFHTGLDFPAAVGAPVRSAAGGRVAYAEFRTGGYGNLIVVRHKRGVRTFYAHLSTLEVTVGQRVTRGQQIGRVGSTGHSTGSHLHFEARLRGAAVDAAPSLGGI